MKIILNLLTFECFERAYVAAHGPCTTKVQLRNFFNMAASLGLRKHK